MRVLLDIDKDIEEDVIIIKARTYNKEIEKYYQLLCHTKNNNNNLVLYQNKKEYLIDYQDIIFFETDEDGIYAHTIKEAYLCKLKLYELEHILPFSFQRISKSAIVNIDHIYSIERNFSSSSLIKFYDSNKEVYVSRKYYKIFKEKMIRQKLALKNDI
ncbi:MAG: LytTR family transcriptional regulator [Bacilli bacterium]|jgi:DNA-binding LytR/AlgR family response regulator|nr:LytTR family transcriptional regulator [Bacilli bacterium]